MLTNYSSLFNRNYSVIGLFVIAMTLSIGLKAQDTTSIEGLYAAARQVAYEQKDYPNAIRLGKKALNLNMGYADILVFIGRVYAWSKQYDSALLYLQHAVDIDPNNEDAYIANSDLEVWNNNQQAALTITEAGLIRLPTSRELLTRKVKILAALKEYKRAFEVVDTLADQYGNNAEIRALQVMLRDLSCRNKVTIKLDGMWFDTTRSSIKITNGDDPRFAPQRYGSIELVTATRIGPWVARVNVANRFNTPGLQYETDFYPKLSKTFYMYLNAGYGDNLEAFPKWRGGASMFANLPKAYEAEVGMRYMYFTNDVYFYTGYIGKYISKFLVGARTYLAPAGNKYTNTTGGSVRYYYGGADDHVTLVAMKGLPIDDRRINVDIFNAGNSYFAELVLKKSFNKVNILSMNVSWLEGRGVTVPVLRQYQIGLGYTKRFL